MVTFGERARAYHAGEIDLNRFFKDTKPVFEACASRLMRRWRTPIAVEREDVVQELMVCSIKFFKKWDPEVGVELGRYVLWNAQDKAKKWMHKQRGARLHGNADSNPGRMPMLLGDMCMRQDGSELEPEQLTEALVYEETQHGTTVRREMYRMVFKKTTDLAVRWGVLALEHALGEVDEAARVLYGDFEVRLSLQLCNEADARRVVRRAVECVLECE